MPLRLPRPKLAAGSLDWPHKSWCPKQQPIQMHIDMFSAHVTNAGPQDGVSLLSVIFPQCYCFGPRRTATPRPKILTQPSAKVSRHRCAGVWPALAAAAFPSQSHNKRLSLEILTQCVPCLEQTSKSMAILSFHNHKVILKSVPRPCPQGWARGGRLWVRSRPLTSTPRKARRTTSRCVAATH
jgi:hypothetical protein